MIFSPVLRILVFRVRIAAVLAGAALSATTALASITTQASVATGGEQTSCGAPENFCYSISASISDNGRYVSFSSVAFNLVPGIYVPSPQVYLHDRLTCTTIRVTNTPSGGPTNVNSTVSSLSGDGRYLAYESSATNILPGVNTGVRQIYLYDRVTGQTSLVSRSIGGQPGNGNSSTATITSDGRYIVYQSAASNLVDNDTNGRVDIFVHDRQNDTTTRVNLTTAGEQALLGDSRRPTISPDGRYVAFDSQAQNFSNNPLGLSRVYLHDRDANSTGVYDEPVGISTTLISVDSNGEIANNNATWPSITDDARLIAFVSRATNLASGITNDVDDIFVHDRLTGQTTRESLGPEGQQGTEISFSGRISADGRYLSFHSSSPQFVGGSFPTGISHAFLRNRITGELKVLSANTAGVQGNLGSEYAVMTPNAQTFAFSSLASNLVPTHVNDWADVFVRSLRPADINGDGVVDVSDLLLLFAQWGQSCTMADLNNDGNVDVSDLLLLFGDWG